MKILTVDELVNQNFNPVFLNALKQFWRTTKHFQCIGTPKSQNLFLFLDGCKITYTDKDNRTYVANSGDIVYTPVGSEYYADMSDFQSELSHTVGINFFLFDACGEPVILSDRIEIFRASSAVPSVLFHQALNEGQSSEFIRKRILLMEILSSIASESSNTKIPARIEKALQYLAEHIKENPSVRELAELCNVSEVYFRKQFKKATGKTPLEYRTALRLDTARTYLEYGDISVQEISDMLGYSTVSHFIKEFGRAYGTAPLKYRKFVRTGAED